MKPASTPPAPPAGRRGAQTPALEADPIEALDDDVLEVSEEDLVPLSAGSRGPKDSEALFRIDDDLFDQPASGDEAGGVEACRAGTGEGWPGEPAAAAPRAQAGVLGGEESPAPPVIDREDEIPERFWAPEIAGLGRRAAALLVDQLLLALVLCAFLGGAWLGLRISGLDADILLGSAGLGAAAVPFALLAVGLSLAFSVFFHGYAGRTPGKALAGLEVRTSDGAPPSWGRVALRWLGAAAGLAAGGLGIAWALFEPSHRGWADLLSGTVVARRRSEPAEGADRR